MTTASKITLVRVVLIPVYMVLMLLSANGADWLRWAAVAVFVIASISDFLDGYIARHYNQVSDFGKFLDPLADKLLVTACMMISVGWGRMPSWVVFIVIAREFAISGLRMVAASNGTVIAAGWSGKIKTSCTGRKEWWARRQRRRRSADGAPETSRGWRGRFPKVSREKW